MQNSMQSTRIQSFLILDMVNMLGKLKLKALLTIVPEDSLQ
jgi:hypothetical protein